jgi:hypothetical protein
MERYEGPGHMQFRVVGCDQLDAGRSRGKIEVQ